MNDKWVLEQLYAWNSLERKRKKNLILFDKATADMYLLAVKYSEKAWFIAIITPSEISSYVQSNYQLPNTFVQKEGKTEFVDYINKNPKSKEETIYNPTFNAWFY